MRYNPARQEIVLKVVYYGPGLAGKTTNLQFLHDRVPAGRASDLVSVDTHSERTIQFDFLAVELGKVQGMDVRLDFYTVPGQSYYAATRRQVLTAADGVVFVADSRREALDENIDAMNEMLNNLRHHGLPDDLPVIVQYNKQDLPTSVPSEQLQPLLNVRGWPSFPASAIGGEGVAETCEALARMLADRLAHSELPVVLTSVPQVAAGPQSQPPAPIRTPAPEPPKSWLITCHRCQSMLDVPSAVVGEIYTCGVCHSQLEVVDPDRGSTRPPIPAARPVTATHQRPVTGQHPRPRPSSNIDADLYQEADIGSGGHALKPPTSAHSASRAGYIAPAGTFPLDGFTVLGVLDENAQGRRLRVRETATGKTFRALVLSQSLLAQPGYREAVEPYARMTGPLRHPNLLHMASLRQAGEEMVFLSADPQDHEPLSHVLARRRALAPPHAIGILRQLVLALEEAARHGAIHGWLRPDAILISAEGSVLVDEICVPPNHRFITRELAGVSAATEYYLAPEYLNDDLRGDIRADIFVLGALLFRMITGDGLVTGYNAMEALHKLSANGPRMLRDAQQGISRELNGFYLKLVAVDRSQRFQTYREVIDALDRFGGGARRQNLQLTAQQRPPSPGPGRPSGTGTGQLGRRGGTGPLPPAPRARTGRTTDPSGASPVLPPPMRRRKSSSAPVVLAVVVVLMMAVAVIAVLMMRPVPLPPAPETASPVPAPKPVATTTTSTAPPAKPVDANQERLEIRRAFADQMVADQFAAALKTTERFRDPLDRREAESQLVARHDGRKQDIEAMLKPGIDPQAVRKALEPFRGAQRLPGDLEWAMAVQSRADALAIDAQAAKPEAPAGAKPADGGDWGPTRPAPLVPAPEAPAAEAAKDPKDPMAGTLLAEQGGPQAKPAPPKPEIPPVADPAAAAFGTVVRALAANQPAQAQAAVNALPVDDRAAPALKQLVDWWPARVQLVNRVAGARAVKLRFNHPTTGELVDVTSADAAGVSVAAANGSGSSLTWGQLPPKVQAKLFVDAAGAAGAAADELGGAIAVELVADDPAMAGVIGKRGKATLADKTAVVDTLLELYGRRAAVAVLNKGFDAARAGTPKGAVDALAEVRKLDKSWTKGLDAEIARLEAASAEPATAAPAPGAAPAAGDLPKDLRDRQAALRTLGWEPVGDAWLEGTSVRLTPNSGISFEMAKGVSGFLVSASGDGYLRLIPSRGAPGAGVKGGIPLPLSPDHVSNYTVTFSRDAMTVLDGRGGVVQSVPLQAPPTLFLVISTADATLSTVPKPTLQ